jgi:integrase/recombinase XerD
MLFDYLVRGGICRYSPATSVRGPKHVVKVGKTPVLSADEARLLFDSIDTSTVAGLRDRALIAVMVFSFARIGAVLKMDMDDYHQRNHRPEGNAALSHHRPAPPADRNTLASAKRSGHD